MARALTAAVVASFLATMAGPALAASQDTTPKTSSIAGDAIANPGLQTALDRINALRRQAGAAPLRLNSALNAAAQGHARDMAVNNYFSHTSRDGRTAGDRITAAGYSWQTYGENIAWGYSSWSTAITGWMNSPGHRANMLNPRFKEIGLGVNNRYYVQDFGTSWTR
jgi:uncharacterized protein YkwD